MGFLRPSRLVRAALVLLAFAPLLATSGCAALGAAAYAMTSTVKVKPHYTGLKGESVGVIVSADPGIRIDYASLQLDISHGVWGKLQKTQANKVEELVGTTFPANRGPDAMYAFQQNHPELVDSILAVAPRLGVSRLIHVEVDDFQLHPEQVPELDRGVLSARVQVIEVAGGTAKVAFDERVHVIFPEHAPEEGVLGRGESVIYAGTLESFTTALVQKFVTYDDQL